MYKFIRLFVFAIALMVCGCAETIKEETGGVQDIQPGDKSIIDSPRPQQENGIEERNI